jgi:hypothetical protein
VLWPELLGTANNKVTIITEQTTGEQIATKIRWFVVVREGNNFCSCLPIMTYGRQGVAKPGVIKCHHAVVYTSRKEPAPQKNEAPKRGEKGLLTSIRVKANSRQEKLDPLSRINFSKIYTVEHNVKVPIFLLFSKIYIPEHYLKRNRSMTLGMFIKSIYTGFAGSGEMY